jgi:hypothetical protein
VELPYKLCLGVIKVESARRLLEGCDDRLGAMERDRRKGNEFGKPGDGVRNAFSFCAPDPCAKTSMVLKGWSEVPRIESVWCPGRACGWFVMYKDVSAGGSERSMVVGVISKYLNVGREPRVDAGTAE